MAAAVNWVESQARLKAVECEAVRLKAQNGGGGNMCSSDVVMLCDPDADVLAKSIGASPAMMRFKPSNVVLHALPWNFYCVLFISSSGLFGGLLPTCCQEARLRVCIQQGASRLKTCGPMVNLITPALMTSSGPPQVQWGVRPTLLAHATAVC